MPRYPIRGRKRPGRVGLFRTIFAVGGAPSTNATVIHLGTDATASVVASIPQIIVTAVASATASVVAPVRIVTDTDIAPIATATASVSSPVINITVTAVASSTASVVAPIPTITVTAIASSTASVVAPIIPVIVTPAQATASVVVVSGDLLVQYGITTIGDVPAGVFDLTPNYIQATKIIVEKDIILKQVSAYILGQITPPNVAYLRIVIWNDNSDSPGTLFFRNQEIYHDGTEGDYGPQWFGGVLSTGLQKFMPKGAYWIGFHAGGDQGFWAYRFLSTPITRVYKFDHYDFDGTDDPFGTPDGTDGWSGSLYVEGLALNTVQIAVPLTASVATASIVAPVIHIAVTAQAAATASVVASSITIVVTTQALATASIVVPVIVVITNKTIISPIATATAAGITPVPAISITSPIARTKEDTDNFNRVDSSSIGSDWTEAAWNGTNVEIASNALAPSGFGGTAAWNENTYKDVEVKATLSVLPSGGVSIYWRMSTTGAVPNGYRIVVNPSSTYAAIDRITGGASVVVSSSSAITTSANDVFTVRHAAGHILVYKNSTLILSAIDTTHTAAGYGGLGFEADLAARWDNFEIRAISPVPTPLVTVTSVATSTASVIAPIVSTSTSTTIVTPYALSTASVSAPTILITVTAIASANGSVNSPIPEIRIEQEVEMRLYAEAFANAVGEPNPEVITIVISDTDLAPYALATASVSASVPIITITAIATSTASVSIPSIFITVTAVASAAANTLTIPASVTVSAYASSTALVEAPVISTASIKTIEVPYALATASVVAPIVQIAMTAVAVSTASVVAPTPTITVTSVASATASVTSPVPEVRVTSPYALATASVVAPIVTAGTSATVVAPYALSTASIVAAVPEIRVTAIALATASVSAPTPVITITTVATATASVGSPTVNVSDTDAAPYAIATAFVTAPVILLTVTAPCASATASATCEVLITIPITSALATASVEAPIISSDSNTIVITSYALATTSVVAPVITITITTVSLASASVVSSVPQITVTAQALATASIIAPTITTQLNVSLVTPYALATASVTAPVPVVAAVSPCAASTGQVTGPIPVVLVNSPAASAIAAADAPVITQTGDQTVISPCALANATCVAPIIPSSIPPAPAPSGGGSPSIGIPYRETPAPLFIITREIVTSYASVNHVVIGSTRRALYKYGAANSSRAIHAVRSRTYEDRNYVIMRETKARQIEQEKYLAKLHARQKEEEDLIRLGII